MDKKSFVFVFIATKWHMFSISLIPRKDQGLKNTARFANISQWIRPLFDEDQNFSEGSFSLFFRHFLKMIFPIFTENVQLKVYFKRIKHIQNVEVSDSWFCYAVEVVTKDFALASISVLRKICSKNVNQFNWLARFGVNKNPGFNSFQKIYDYLLLRSINNPEKHLRWSILQR